MEGTSKTKVRSNSYAQILCYWLWLWLLDNDEVEVSEISSSPLIVFRPFLKEESARTSMLILDPCNVTQTVLTP